MAIAKLTKSQNAILFVDDFGNVFITPVFNLKRLLDDKVPSKFILFNRMPTKVPHGKFHISPLYDPENNTMKTMGEYDPMASVNKKEEEGKYEDKVLL